MHLVVMQSKFLAANFLLIVKKALARYKMSMTRIQILTIAALALCANAPAPKTAPAPLASLVKAVDIPYHSFTLKNGLRVLVHTDRKAPIVGVTVYYRVGSKHEPRGKTGFAHLYEHLFFGGSENVTNFDVPLEAAGSPGTNGSTWYDRTNYVETVPTGALALALFEESDRMGHLLGAVTQDKLDKQRGVVQNEKRQGDNESYGLLQYAVNEGLFPVGHPYRHAAIGSMADLNAASLADVRRWFAMNYAPNNVVLALSGDVDLATAKRLVTRYFAHIPRGPKVAPVKAAPVDLPAPITRTMHDQVATTRLWRWWSGPGLNHVDTPALAIAMRILGGLASSRLDNSLVRGQQLAVAVTAEAEVHEQISQIGISMDIKPGVDRKAAETAFTREIARFLNEGPTADEVLRAKTKHVSEEIAALESVGDMGGKGATLAEGLLFSGDPAHYKADLARIAAVTPDDVRAAARRWLLRPALSVNFEAGARREQGDTMGGWGDESTHPAPHADTKKPAPPLAKSAPRKAPPVADVGPLTFPQIQRAKLANGISVILARRTAVPKVLVTISFDAGYAADAQDRPGTQGLMLNLLDEGVAHGAYHLNATEIAEMQERLGAGIAANATLDNSSVTLNALSANLAPSLELMRHIVRYPAFAADDVARVRGQQTTALAATLASPQGLAMHVLNPLLYPAAHPYAQPGDGLGDAAGLAAQTPDTLRAAHAKWLRPDLARITVVGDMAMDQLLPMLEASFGDWQAPAGAAPVKQLDVPLAKTRTRIVVYDRPGAPQSFIIGAKILPITGRDAGHEAVDVANDVLGGSFLSRLNMDLREDKSWSYGVQSVVRQPLGPRSFLLFAPVQTDRTGDSLKAIIADMQGFTATKPVTGEELLRATDGKIRSLPTHYESNAQVMDAIRVNDRLGRGDGYITGLPATYRKIDAAAVNA
ncbi:MAG: hypothetical protein RLY97_1446, partial [Pseudomonadota bacterium]